MNFRGCPYFHRTGYVGQFMRLNLIQIKVKFALQTFKIKSTASQKDMKLLATPTRSSEISLNAHGFGHQPTVKFILTQICGFLKNLSDLSLLFHHTESFLIGRFRSPILYLFETRQALILKLFKITVS